MDAGAECEKQGVGTNAGAVPAASAAAADADADDGDFSPPQGPAKAIAAAQSQEYARVTLYRALVTILHMLELRGFTPRIAADIRLNGDGPERLRTAAVRAIESYAIPARAGIAEQEHHVLIEAEVMAPVERFTTAWSRGTAEGTKLVVLVVSDGSIDTVRGVQAMAEDDGVAHVLMLSRDPLTSYSMKTLPGTPIEHFLLSELQGDIARHCLVPVHRPLDATMARVVRDRYMCGILPRLLTSDVMVRYLGLAQGQLVLVVERFGREQAETRYFEVVQA